LTLQQDAETEGMKSPAESTSESLRSLKQTMEPVDDIQITEMTEEQAVTQTVEQAVTQTEESMMTETEECREKPESLQYSEETLQVIEGE